MSMIDCNFKPSVLLVQQYASDKDPVAIDIAIALLIHCGTNTGLRVGLTQLTSGAKPNRLL